MSGQADSRAQLRRVLIDKTQKKFKYYYNALPSPEVGTMINWLLLTKRKA
jgi:hypothetical protein